jgi:hypothetical protein
MDGTDHDALTRETERMSRADNKIQEVVYAAKDGGPGSGAPRENVVDAEFEDVADQNRAA